MTFDDLERQNKGFYRFFCDFCLRHISTANCAKITRDRSRQPAYETFSIKRSFH